MGERLVNRMVPVARDGAPHRPPSVRSGGSIQPSSSFRHGPDPDRLGDPAGSPSAADSWWERQFRSEDVHCIVHLHVGSEEECETASARLRGLARE